MNFKLVPANVILACLVLYNCAPYLILIDVQNYVLIIMKQKKLLRNLIITGMIAD